VGEFDRSRHGYRSSWRRRDAPAGFSLQFNSQPTAPLYGGAITGGLTFLEQGVWPLVSST
jgi:hypothetical protein